MSRWKNNELAILEQFVESVSDRAITSADHASLATQLPGRSLPAIKKKLLEVRKPRPRIARAAALWTPDDVRRLAVRYVGTDQSGIKAKMASIIHEFPGRTIQAAMTKLRVTYPDIYYGRAGIPDEWMDNQQQHQPDPQERLQGSSPIHQDQEVHRAVGIDVTTGTEHPPSNTGGDDRMAGETNPPQDSDPPELAKALARIMRCQNKTQGKVVKPRGVVSAAIIKKVDAALNHALAQIKHMSASDDQKRSKEKLALLAAGILLTQQVNLQSKTARVPAHVHLERKVQKLKRRLENTQKLLVWKKNGLPRHLKDLATYIKGLNMKPAQYTQVAKDELARLELTLAGVIESERKAKLRAKFEERPSPRVIAERTDPLGPGVRAAEEYFRGLFSESSEGHKPTPGFNKWLGKLKRHRLGTEFTDQLKPECVFPKVQAALRKAAPWKAAGEDGIPSAVFKTLPSAALYLQHYVLDILCGHRKVTERDVRARVTLIHKGGDAGDPANYRPIAVLNLDYKILTSVITSIVKDALPEWAVPTEQLARAGVWGTVHGLLFDKACTQAARVSRRAHYTAWYDFTKAYDSVPHRELIRLVKALPLHPCITNTLSSIIGKWSVRVHVGKSRTAPVYIRRGVYQGDTISPLLFILMSAFLIHEIKTDTRVNRVCRGKHEVVAFMDDFKAHAPSEEGIRTITEVLRTSAREVGLELNVRKCGIYSRDYGQLQDGEEDTDFLPRVRESYKYLGIHQLERDLPINEVMIREKMLVETKKILDSSLATSQKIKLYNTTVIPAVTYVLGNLFPQEKRATSLKKCRDLDKEVRKLLVDKGIKGDTTTRVSTYIGGDRGGLGLKSIEWEVELLFVKRGKYLESHPDLESTRAKYVRLYESGWRNPTRDAEKILQAYEITAAEPRRDKENVGDYCRRVACLVKNQQMKWALEERGRSHYGRLVLGEERILSIPAYYSLKMEDWMVARLLAASEEQVHGLGATNRKLCRLGCQRTETAYHVVSACVTPAYTTRHDTVVSWVIRGLLESTGAPRDTIDKSYASKATLVTEYVSGNRNIKVRAGPKIITNRGLAHNRPDIVLELDNPSEVYVFEVSVAHLQNYRLQERLKRARYAVNSETRVDASNLDDISRGVNLIGWLEENRRCPVHFGVFVVGAFGEILATEEHRHFAKLLSNLGMTTKKTQKLIQKCSFAAAKSSAQIIIRRLSSAA